MWVVVGGSKWRSEDKKQNESNYGNTGDPEEQRAHASVCLRSVLTERTRHLFGLLLNLLTPLKPDDCIRPTFNVQSVNKANVARLCCHDHRMRSFTGAEEAYAFQQCAICHACRSKNDLLSWG
jgi:hypothetical protein